MNLTEFQQGGKLKLELGTAKPQLFFVPIGQLHDSHNTSQPIQSSYFMNRITNLSNPLARNRPKSEIIIRGNVLVFLFLSFLMSVNKLHQLLHSIERVEDRELLTSLSMTDINSCRKKLKKDYPALYQNV